MNIRTLVADSKFSMSVTEWNSRLALTCPDSRLYSRKQQEQFDLQVSPLYMYVRMLRFRVKFLTAFDAIVDTQTYNLPASAILIKTSTATSLLTSDFASFG